MSIQIWYKPKTVGRDEYLDFYTEPVPGGRYGQGGFQTAHISKSGVREEYYDSESAKKTAAQKAADYLGIPIWEISGYEYLKPPDVAPDAGLQAISKREAEQQAVTDALHARREALRQGYSGEFSETALKDVTTDPGEYLPSFIQNLSQEKAETMIKEGKIGGWESGVTKGRYFRTEQEATEYDDRIASIPRRTGAAAQKAKFVQQAGAWKPELYPSLQVSKDLEKKFKETYEPYTTIEGTTVYKPKGQPESVTVPRFGKMVPGDSQGAALSILGVDIIRSDSFTRNTNKFISENFEKGERFVSDKLMLHEILNPLIKSIEERKPVITGLSIGENASAKEGLKFRQYEDIALGGIKGIRDEPLTAAGNLALTILVTKGIGALPKVAGVTAGIGKGAVAKRISAINILGAGLAAAYAGDVSVRYATAPNKSEFLGELAATELIPFAAGGYIGAKPFPKLRIKSNINTAYKIIQSNKVVKSQVDELRRFYHDESASVVIRRQPKKLEMPGSKLLKSLDKDQLSGNLFTKEPETAYSRFMKDLNAGTVKQEAQFFKKYSAKKQPEKSYLPHPTKITRYEPILTAKTIKTERRGFKTVDASKWNGALDKKQGDLVKTRQRTIQITKQKTKTAQAVKEKTKTAQITKEQTVTKTAPLMFISTASRMMNQLRTATTTATRTISQEKAAAKPLTFVSEVSKAMERTKELARERTREIARERIREAVAEKTKEQVREKVREATRERTATKTRLRIPVKPIILKLPKFSSEISKLAKKKKRKGKYIWNIKNPVPTLKQFVG